MGDSLAAVCDRCKVKFTFDEHVIQGWSGGLRVFFQKHARCNFTGCRVVQVDNPCPNRARDYEEA